LKGLQENHAPFEKYYSRRKNSLTIRGKVVIIVASELSLKQIVEGIPGSLLSATDRDIEGFQKILDETIKLRESHRNLQKMIRNFSTSTTIKSS
jgi:hypothetical protein